MHVALHTCVRRHVRAGMSPFASSWSDMRARASRSARAARATCARGHVALHERVEQSARVRMSLRTRGKCGMDRSEVSPCRSCRATFTLLLIVPHARVGDMLRGLPRRRERPPGLQGRQGSRDGGQQGRLGELPLPPIPGVLGVLAVPIVCGEVLGLSAGGGSRGGRGRRRSGRRLRRRRLDGMDVPHVRVAFLRIARVPVLVAAGEGPDGAQEKDEEGG